VIGFIFSPTKERKMNRKQRTLTVLFVAASFMAFSTAHAAVDADPASVVRGSLGVSLENLSLNSNFGELTFLLNGGFALLFGAVALSVVASRQRKPIRDHGHLDDLRSGNSVTTI
jgi:hypothetical protein